MRGQIEWDFSKLLINVDGEFVAYFEPNIDPMDDAISDEVEALLPPES